MSWTHRAFSVINFLLKVWNCHHYSQFGTACVTHKGLGKGFRWKWGEFLGDCEMCFQHILAAMKDYTTCGGFITSIRKKKEELSLHFHLLCQFLSHFVGWYRASTSSNQHLSKGFLLRSYDKVLNQYKREAPADFLSRRFSSKEGGKKPLAEDFPNQPDPLIFQQTVLSK